MDAPVSTSKTIRTLVIGSGAREHALALRLQRSESTDAVIALPGNPAMRYQDAITLEVQTDPNDWPAVVKLIERERINLVVVGPEQPLVEGMVDYLAEHTHETNPMIFAPRKAAAMLEGSKAFAKAFMLENGIPTARFQTFTPETREEGVRFLESLKPPYVLKADGLAAGKGVLIPETLQDAVKALDSLLGGQFGEASRTVVIEEFLQGREVSVFAVCDGEHYKLLAPAKDYKRALEGDKGLNTGGMGSVSPVWYADDLFMQKVESRIVRPTLEGMKRRGTPYVGFLFLGLMCSPEGDPYVIEYNVRMGDPETQSVMMRTLGDFSLLLYKAAQGNMQEVELSTDPRYAVCVTIASEGYPERYQKGKRITISGLPEEDQSAPGQKGRWRLGANHLFYAGIKALENGEISTNGGRVLSACSLGDTLLEAKSNAMRLVDCVDFEGKIYRGDIGNDLMDKS